MKCVCVCVCARARACVCECLCVLDGEGNRVFTSRAVAAVSIDLTAYQTAYSDCLTIFREP